MAKINSKFRVFHRYLGFFLAGIMTIYALSGIVMIFRKTDAFKIEKQKTAELEPNLKNDEIGKALRIRNFKITEENGSTVYFENGTYDKATGVTNFRVKELPTVIQKFEKLHKATTDSPLFYLNIFFGTSLLFFAVSAFFMFARTHKNFKKGVYVAIGGIIFAIIMLLL